MKEKVLETVFCNKIKEVVFRALLIDNFLMFQVSENGGNTWETAGKTGNKQSFLDCYDIVSIQDEVKNAEGLYTGFDVIPVSDTSKE